MITRLSVGIRAILRITRIFKHNSKAKARVLFYLLAHLNDDGRNSVTRYVKKINTNKFGVTCKQEISTT